MSKNLWSFDVNLRCEPAMPFAMIIGDHNLCYVHGIFQALLGYFLYFLVCLGVHADNFNM